MITNYYFFLLISLIFFVIKPDFDNNTQDFHARSFLYTRPLYDYLLLERLLARTVDYKKGKLQAGFSIIATHQQSMHNHKTTEYFFADHRTELSVAGDDTIQKASRDIRAEWINLDSDFFSVFSLKPKQKLNGVIIEYIQQLSKFTDISFFEDSYIRILLPIYSTKNNVDFHATQKKKRELLEAFNNPSWDFAHIKNEIQKKTGVGKLEFTFGTKYEIEHLTLNYETMIAIPSGNKQDAKTLFQPVVGNNKHFEIGGRLCINYGLCEPENALQVDFFLDLQGILFVKNRQHRTFDLKKKPLSRYLLFNTPSTQIADSNIPGVNVLTRECSVRPFLMADFSVGWTWNYKKFCGEIGYNVWGRHQERVEIKGPFLPIFGIAGTEPGITASFSTIAQRAPNDPIFIPITIFDLDFRSAQSASALNQTIHFAIGRHHESECSESLFSAVFFREFAQQIGALSKWGIALKFTKTL